MSTGFLVTNLTGRLKRISDVVNQHLLKKLYICVTLSQNQINFRNNEWVCESVVDMYSSTFNLFPNLDVRIILNEVKNLEEKITKITDYNVDVVVVPKNYDVNKISSLKNQNKNLEIVYVDEAQSDDINLDTYPIKIYNNVVLGGTFDRLHTGHKILLSEAMLRCSKKLTVGVTAGDMIKGKKLWELIQPCFKRVEAVETFLKEVDSTLDYEVVPITDMYGPTKSDPNLNMIVVSAETYKGGLKVNELRKEIGLNELDIYTVKLAEDSNKNDVEEEKISSSNNRIRLLGTYIKPTEPKPNLPTRPYVIGLTGGVASGKSSICEYLAENGVAVIDCDKIGHELYKPDTPIYYELIKLFGKQIVASNGEISRKELGAIVFNDKSKLQMLNDLMWPAILKESLEKCEKFYVEEKQEIVVLEAAVLVKAGWHEHVHEVWATIIPEKEAVNRIMNRNKLSEEQAYLRVQAQPCNLEIVEVANVIFCSLWSYEFTRSQVDKAWEALQEKMKDTNNSKL